MNVSREFVHVPSVTGYCVYDRKLIPYQTLFRLFYRSEDQSCYEIQKLHPCFMSHHPT